MSNVTRFQVRKHALAVATALALSSSLFAGSAARPDRVDLAALQPSQTYDRFIVKYRATSDERRNPAALRIALDTAARATPAPRGHGVQLQKLFRIALGAEVVKANRKLDRVEAESLMRQLAANPDVEYVEIDQLMKPVLTPNDTRYGEQWHYFEAVGGIKANEAWNVVTGTGVVVAVIDTGITGHTDLNANVVAGYDFIFDAATARDGNGRDSNPADQGDWSAAGECGTGSPATNSTWHGTHVAGTVGAVTNNASGVAGVAYNAKIMPVRVLGKCGGYTSDIADSIIWASGGAVSGIPTNTNPVEVINMSLGGGGACGTTTQSAINGAVGRGTIVVVAAGNSNADASGFNPASCANVVNVGSTDRNGARSSFSNYGSTVDVAGPGSSILSTLNTGTTTPGTQNYVIYSGTSMAAPHVAGVAALMQSRVVKTPAQVESLLKSTARAFPSTPSQPIGSGIVNAKAAVDAAGGTPPPTGGTLTKGVAKTNLSAAAGTSLNYTMTVPAGSTNLTFKMSGGTGDADMYVKFGSAPTNTVYDCRPFVSGNAETCTFAAPSAGTYYVRLTAFTAFSGVSLLGNYNVRTYANSADYAISDNVTTDSPITVSGRSGNAPSTASVFVNIVHTYIGDLKVDLVAPDGSLYNIHNRTGTSTDNISKTVTLNLSTELLNGTWKLRVNDNAAKDTGYINAWNVTF